MDLAFWRFVVIGIMILFFRRLPWVMATYRAIPELRNYKEALCEYALSRSSSKS